MKKIIALILCILMLAVCFVSCKNDNDKKTSDSTSSTTDTKGNEPGIEYPIDVSVECVAEETENTVDISSLPKSTKISFGCFTDKDPYAYKVGEDVTFTLALQSGFNYVSCEQFKIKIRYDGIEEAKEITVSGETGRVRLVTQVAQPGFILVDVEACNGSGKAYSNAEVIHGGAGAEIEKLAHNGEEPSDFDAFWQKNIDGLLKINPDIIKFDKIENYMPSNTTYDFYDVKILAVDDGDFFKGKDSERHDYVSGIIAVPKNASEKSCGIYVPFDGHGVYASSADAMLDGKTIVFDVLAHSIEANGDKYYYSKYKNLIGNYGIDYQDETDPENIYYKNMILRDLQALRFLVSYFGEGGEGGNIWNGTDVAIDGFSQGGFQASAVTALADKVGVNVTNVTIGAPWLCDMASYCTDGSTAIASVFWPKGSYDVLAYYDSSLFAKRIKCNAFVKIGLGDETTPAAGVTILYHNLGSSNKTLQLIQNKSHGYESSTKRVYTYK